MPRRLFVPALVVGLVAPVGLPFLHPVPAVSGLVAVHIGSVAW